MFIPGKAENWVILIDVADRGIFNFPTSVFINHIFFNDVKIIKSLITRTRPKFPNGLERLWILNPSTSLSMSWSAISSKIKSIYSNNSIDILDENTNKKIGFVPKDDFKKLYETISPD